jgi:nucleotide-binding universal stress UspA family protein
MNVLLALDLAHDPEQVVDAAAPHLDRLAAKADLTWIDRFAEASAWSKSSETREILAAQHAALREEAAEHLRALLARLPASQQGRTVIDEGDPVDAIVARSSSYQLVVVGTHGRRGFAHLALGSVAERVSRLAQAPVLVVRPEAARAPGRMLLAVDLRDRPEVVVDAGAWWAEALRVRLDLAFVEDMAVAAPFLTEVDVHGRILEHLDRERVVHEERLQELLIRVPSPFRGQAILESGDPATRLAELANGYDLLASVTHARTGMSRFWLGSRTEATLRAAPVSMLVLQLPG